MTSPAFIHFFQFVVSDVENFKFWLFKSYKFGVLVVWNIEPSELREILLTWENGDIFDLVLRDVKLDEVLKLSQDSYIDNVIILEVQELHMLRLKQRVIQSLNSLIG